MLLRILNNQEPVSGTQTHLKHPGAGLGPVVEELGADLGAGALDLVGVVHVGDALRVLDGGVRVLRLGPHHVERHLRAPVQALALRRLLVVVRVDRDLLAPEEHCAYRSGSKDYKNVSRNFPDHHPSSIY